MPTKHARLIAPTPLVAGESITNPKNARPSDNKISSAVITEAPGAGLRRGVVETVGAGGMLLRIGAPHPTHSVTVGILRMPQPTHRIGVTSFIVRLFAEEPLSRAKYSPTAISGGIHRPPANGMPIDNDLHVKHAARMAALRLANFRLDEELIEALQAIKERDGIPLTAQVRRALLAWVESKGAILPSRSKPKRVAASRRRT